MKKGLVSIITPCYNGEKYLNRYFESILKQTYKQIEVIFINDGSDDKTEEIAIEHQRKLKEKGYELKYIYQENAGQASAINTGLLQVEGEFLYWMDADDYCENNAIEILVNFLEQNKNYNIVRGKVRFIQNGKEIRIGKPNKEDTEYIFENYVLGKNAYCFVGIFMVRMETFDKQIKNRQIYNSKEGQNWQLILPNVYNQKCGFVDSIVYNYNIIEDSHSHKKRDFKQEIKKLKGHQDILINVINEIEKMDTKYRNNIIKKVKQKYHKEIFKIRVKNMILVKLIRKNKEKK